MFKKLILLSFFITPVFADGLMVEVVNNLTTPYVVDLIKTTTYQDKTDYRHQYLKPCDTNQLSLNNFDKTNTWCGYGFKINDKSNSYAGGYIILEIRPLNVNKGDKNYVRVVIETSPTLLYQDTYYTEAARESSLHVHKICYRFNDNDVCKISLDPQ